MEILVFRYKGDILLMLDKSTIDEKQHSKQIAQMLQSKLEESYPNDWLDIDFHEGGQLVANHPLYEWFGDNGIIKVMGEPYKVRDVMQEMFTVI